MYCNNLKRKLHFNVKKKKKKAERVAYGFVSRRSCIRDCTCGMSETLSKYYKHHPAVKNGQHGPTPCFGIIQRNRRDALCFTGYVILFKSGAIIKTHDWHRISCKGSVSVKLLARWFESLLSDPHRCHCSLTVLYIVLYKQKIKQIHWSCVD